MSSQEVTNQITVETVRVKQVSVRPQENEAHTDKNKCLKGSE